MNARYYDPSLAVFITPDPAMSGSNHYAYASCNPIRYNDPTGLAFDDSFDGGSNDSESPTTEDKTPTETVGGSDVLTADELADSKTPAGLHEVDHPGDSLQHYMSDDITDGNTYRQMDNDSWQKYTPGDGTKTWTAISYTPGKTSDPVAKTEANKTSGDGGNKDGNPPPDPPSDGKVGVEGYSFNGNGVDDRKQKIINGMPHANEKGYVYYAHPSEIWGSWTPKSELKNHDIDLELFQLISGGFNLARIALSGGMKYVIMNAKDGKKDGRSNNRNVQQQQIDSIRNELKNRGVDVNKNRQEIHDILHEGNYNYKDALNVLLEHFNLK